MSKQKTMLSELGTPVSESTELSTTKVHAEARDEKTVEAVAVLAKTYLRDESRNMDRVIDACGRMKLAEISHYQYARGGQEIVGPSVHLARTLASYWGNIDYGWRELSRDTTNRESQIETFCWDIENNTRESRVFVVSHARDTRSGKQWLTDERSIYECISSAASRRLRDCILHVIPCDVVALASETCLKTLESGHETPLKDRITSMISAFNNCSVTESQIAAKYGKPCRSLNERDMVQLRRILMSLKDGVGSVKDFFDTEVEAEAPKKTAKKKKAVTNNKTEEIAAAISEAKAPAF